MLGSKQGWAGQGRASSWMCRVSESTTYTTVDRQSKFSFIRFTQGQNLWQPLLPPTSIVPPTPPSKYTRANQVD
eukprot:scaffold268877_cov47-Attheya_sp.AAC.2